MSKEGSATILDQTKFTILPQAGEKLSEIMAKNEEAIS